MSLSSQQFRTEFLYRPTLEDCDRLMERAGEEAFVLVPGDPTRALFVHPGLYRTLRDLTGAPGEVDAFESGVLDATSAGQIVVGPDVPAAVAARLLQEIDGALAVVVAGGDPTGVFVPSWIAEVLSGASVVEEAGLSDDVAGRLHQDGVGDALAVLDDRLADFHSERISYVSPRPLECLYGNGHFVPRCPCRRHRGAECRRAGGDP